MDLSSAFRMTASVNNSHITFVYPDGREERISYNGICRRALCILGAMQSKGLRPGDEVIIQVEDQLTFICIFWGCIIGKIIPIPLSLGVQSEQKNKVFKVWNYLLNPFLVCDEVQLQRLEAFAETMDNLAGYDQMKGRTLDPLLLLDYVDAGRVEDVLGEDIAYVQFSSGSTGDPKGVILTHDNLLCNIRDIVKSLQITDSDTLLSWMPLTHDMGMIGFHLTGAVENINAVCIPTPMFIRRPMIWMEKSSLHKASVLYSPNFGLDYFLSALGKAGDKLWDLTSVRIVINGAESISDTLCADFTTALQEYGLRKNVMVAAYGLAEASVEVSAMPVGTEIRHFCLHRDFLNIAEEIRELAPDSEKGVSFADVGYPVSYCQLRITGDNDNELSERTVGHIQIRGRNVTRGYYRNTEETDKVFTTDHWLRTGDIGFLFEGRLIVTGRLKNIIIINGQNYYPQDIERLIIRAGIVKQGRVVACAVRDDQGNREILVIFILFRGAGKDFTPIRQAVKNIITENLGITVHEVVPVHRIPKTTSGKIRHFELAGNYKRGAYDMDESLLHLPQEGIGGPAVAKGSPVQESMLALVRSVLKDHTIELTGRLAKNGLDSIRAIQLIGRIRDEWGKEISVETLYKCDSVDALCTHLFSAPEGMADLLSSRKQGGPFFDLSPSQKRLFGEYVVNRNATAYHIPLVYSIKGAFHPEILEASFQGLVKKYEILRTSFEWVDKEPRQQVHEYDSQQVLVRYDDLCQAPTDHFNMEDYCREFIDRPFSLDLPSQFRVMVVRRKKDEYVLVFVIHHILIDGWSLALLFSSLCDHYNENNKPVSSESGEAVLQFSDYVYWQQRFLTSAFSEGSRDYWLAELENLPEPAHLADKGLVSATGGPMRIKHVKYIFEKQQGEQLRLLAQRMNSTPFGIIMSLLNVLIYRYTGQSDIITGFDVTGRNSGSLDKVVGYLINTLCLRILINGELPFVEVVHRVTHKIHAAIGHQLYPFEKILEEKKAGGGLGGNTLFKVLVLYQDFLKEYPSPHFNDCVLTKESIELSDGYADVVLEFLTTGDDIELHIAYNEIILDDVYATRIFEHFCNLLCSAAQDAGKKIAGLDMLTAEERLLLLPEKRNVDVKHLRLPVHLLFERRTVVSPESVAVISGNTKLTYRELNERANKVAHFINHTLRLRPDEKVGFMVSRGEKIVIAILAILKAGGCYVAIDPETPMRRCEKIVSDCNMRYLLTDDDLYSRISERFDREFLVSLDDKTLPFADMSNPVYQGSMEDLAYVIYTSGSAGAPKGVMVEHQSLASYVRNFISYFDITGEDVFIQQASVMFDTMIEEIFPALCTSGKVVIAKDGGRDIEGLLSAISKYNATILSTTPLVLREINNCPDSRIASLKLVISGGDLLHPSDIDKIFNNVAVYNTYGPAEGTVCATYKRLVVLADAPLIGKPIAGASIFILDKDRQVMPIGRTGEIYIEGRLARGYLNLPALTAERFVPGLFEGQGRLFRTGDRGRILGDGDVEFLGRNDIQLKIRGHRVEPGEIECVIKGYPGTELTAVVPGRTEGTLVAYITVNSDFKLDGLKDHIADYLPLYMIPQYFQVIGQMPLTQTGKIDRQYLAGIPKTQELPAKPLEATVGEMEKKIVQLVREILQVEELDPSANFFDHGCDSILAARMTGRIHMELHYKLAIRDIFLYPTVLLLGMRVRQLHATVFSRLLRLPESPYYELSPSQKRLWILDRIYKESAAYHEGEIYEMNGQVDCERVARSFETIVAQNEILRTVFRQFDDEPRQIIIDVKDHFFDFLYVESGDVLQTPGDMLEKYRREPFDLAHGPLYRIRLIKATGHRFFLVVVLHHIVTDDWSVRSMLRDFLGLYRKETGYVSPRSVPGRLRYRDYTGWINGNIKAGYYLPHRDYWLGIFATPVPALEMATDVSRPIVQKGNGGVLHSSIDGDLLAQLRIYRSKHHASLFMLLLSGLSILLSRYTGQGDFVIATPVSGRDHPDLDDLVGFFINILPLRIQLDPEDTSAAAVQKVMDICLDAYDHRMYPFEELIGDLRLDRDMSRSPLFDVLVNFTGYADHAAEVGEWPFSLEKLPKERAGSKCDLAFYFEEQAENISCMIEYDSDLFSRERMASLLRHFNTILRIVISSPAIRIKDIDYLGAAEKQQITEAFNDTLVRQRFDHVLQPVLWNTTRYPDRKCITCNGVTLTYGEVARRLEQMTRQIADGLNPTHTSRIGLFMERSADQVIAVLAIWKTGAVYVPLEPEWPAERLLYIIGDADISLVLTDKKNSTACAELAGGHSFRVICIDTEITDSDTAPAKPSLAGDDTAYLIYTSGTTGSPKGVEIGHRSLINVLLSLESHPGACVGDIMLSVSSCVFDISLSEYFLPLVVGAQLVIASKKETTDMELLKQLLVAHQPTLMQATPGLWHTLVRCGWEGNIGLKAITCGEPLSDELKTALLERVSALWNFYGPTETTIFSTGKRIAARDEPVTIGAPVDNTHIYVLDGYGKMVPVGVFGELYIGGAGVAKGYLNRPALTAERFVHVKGIQGIVYASGDIGRWLSDGTIEYKGRSDSQVKIRGFRIELGEIESKMMSDPHVEAAVVVVKRDLQGDKMLVGFVVDSPGMDCPENEMRQFLGDHLPSYMIPARIIKIPKMPMTVSGKIDRKCLSVQAYGIDRTDFVQRVPPATEIEMMLVEIWESLLERTDIGTTDSFFEIGGHSLKANQMVNKISRKMDIELNLADVFIHHTIRQLAAFISRLEEQKYHYIELI